MKTCRECIYWKRFDGAIPEPDEERATCRRYPPSNVRSPAGLHFAYESVFPVLKASEDCGEFKAAHPYTPSNLDEFKKANQKQRRTIEDLLQEIGRAEKQKETIIRLTKERDEARENSDGETHRAEHWKNKFDVEHAALEVTNKEVGIVVNKIARLEREARDAREVIRHALKIAGMQVGSRELDDFTYKARAVLEYEPKVKP